MSLYKDICKTERKLKSLKGEEYYDTQDDLKDLLGVILPQLHTLTKRQILHVLALCSSHRPTQPHVILMLCGDAYKAVSK